MSRKTYHHLKVGDFVVAERCVLAEDKVGVKVVEQLWRGEIVESDPKAKTLKMTTAYSGGRIASISKQSGWEWGKDVGDEGGCWRIAPAYALKKGEEAPAGSRFSWVPARDLYFVYPGQPLVIATFITYLYASPEMAAVPSKSRIAQNPQSWCAAEGNVEIPGAGGQATKAVEALMRFRKHGSIDEVIKELHEQWERTVGPRSGNHESAFDLGQKRAEALEPKLREALKIWLL